MAFSEQTPYVPAGSGSLQNTGRLSWVEYKDALFSVLSSASGTSRVPREVLQPQTSAATRPGETFPFGGTFLHTGPCWSIHSWLWPNRAGWETDPARSRWCSQRWLTPVLDWTQITKYLDAVAPLFLFGSRSFAVISFPLTPQLCTVSVRSSLSFTNYVLKSVFLGMIWVHI